MYTTVSTLKMEAVRSSETLVNLCQTIRRHFTEHGILHWINRLYDTSLADPGGRAV